MHLLNPLVFAAYFLCVGFCSAQVNSNITSSEPCQSRGICGAFGVCYQKDHPICSCLPGFEPRSEEWYSGNWSGGCVRRVGLNCNNRTTTDRFARVHVVLVAGYVESWSGPERECQGRCLTNCSCLAYAFNGATGCRFWSGSLADVQKFPSDSISQVYIRLSNSEFGQNQVSKKMIMVLLLVGFFILSICTYFSRKWILARRGKKKSIELAKQGAYYSVDTSVQDVLVHINLEELTLFKLEILAIATDNFCEASKLGKGGFGTVYKGELVDGSEIAVKRLSETSVQGMKEFMNEVVLMSKLQHRNVVRLTGCCIENKEAMLVYEYMPNKSLDFYLFDQSQEALDWRKRWNIIEGICRGLLYLHRDSRLKIIHRDLKPSNILLDDDWNAKISDFGMARIFGTKPDHANTLTVVGTFGYMAPEGKFSEKSDVFSFGILMLQIATGRRIKDGYQEGSLNLLGHVWNLWHENNIASLIDTRISSMRYRVQVMRCIQIGLLCVEAIPGDRPSISAVLSMLTTQILQLPKPKMPALHLY